MPGVAFVVNGSLVRGSGHFLALCREAAARHGWRAEFLVTEKAEAGVAAANSAALDGIDLVVAVGGDGTVRGCAEGLARTGVPLGHRAARHRQPARQDAARTRASAGRARRRARVTRDRRRRPDDRPRRRRRGAVYRHGGHGARRRRRRRDQAEAPVRLARLRDVRCGAPGRCRRPGSASALDGAAPVEREARSVVVGNSGLLPGGFSLLPDARLDDGLLDVGVLAPHGPFGWPRLATRVLTHSHRQDRMLERFQARKVEINATALPPPGGRRRACQRPAIRSRLPSAKRLDGANAPPLTKL